MSWIHVDDECGLILHAIDRSDAAGALNGTAPNPVQNKAFTKALGDALNRPAFLPAPAPALRLLLGEMADALLLSGQRVLPRKALDTGYHFTQPYLGPALEKIFSRR
jgi:NAD dependent epimerase/dehydratase family enzyme